MPLHVNALLKQAITTFGGLRELFPKNLEKLKQSLDRTKGGDIGLHSEHELFRADIWSRPGKAPVSYIDIYEDNIVSVGVFILRDNMKLPLHNHPHMHGLIKVIHGTLKISSFSVIQRENQHYEVDCHPPLQVQHMDAPCLLEPHKQNLHEIESMNGIAAFIDILAPPYDVFIPEIGKRKCSYYNRSRQTGLNKMLLEEIDCPSWFWTDSYPYTGPSIENFDESQKKSNIL